jgi:tetratricopeptide (TPR) repeat protein
MAVTFRSREEATSYVFGCIERGQHAVAEKLAGELTKRDPGCSAFWLALAYALDGKVQAIRAAKRCSILRPMASLALQFLSLQVSLNRHERLHYAVRAVITSPDSAGGWIALTNALQPLSIDGPFAHPERRGPVVDPNSREAWHAAGQWLRAAGRHEDAIRSILRALRVDSPSGSSLYLLSLLDPARMPADVVEVMEHRFNSGSVVGEEAETGAFALFAWYDHRREEDTAFRWLEIANRERRMRVTPENSINKQILHRVVGAPLITRRVSSERQASAGPIFVVGLPGSGTTLVDTMLSMHESIGSAGELPVLSDLAKRLPGVPIGHALLDEPTLAALADAYLTQSREYSPTAKPYLIDKMPANFIHIGLAHALFPDAPALIYLTY